MELKFHPFDLRIDCGRWKDGLVIENPRPLFSWAVQSTAKDQYQASCRITLESDTGTVWDSGWVMQREQSLRYSGEPLVSTALYTLKLQVQNNHGAYSEPLSCSFMTSLMEPWHAQWICPEKDFGDSVIYTVKRFSLSDLPNFAMLYACGIGVHQVWLNGERIAPDEWMVPALSSYDKRRYYRAYPNLQSRMRIGENVIGIAVAPGWRRNEGDYLSAVNGRKITFMGYPQLTASLELIFRDGKSTSIQTDESWNAYRGPVVETNIYQGEVYDARMEIPNWCTVDMLGTGIRCRITEPIGASTIMMLQELEPVTIGRIYAPRIVTNPKPGIFVFDFGQNLAGVCELMLPPDLPEGSRITVRHAELLDEQGMLYTAPLRTAAATDCYIAGKSDGNIRIWHPDFTYHGFRYAEVTGLNCVPDGNFIRALALYNAVDNRSAFRCGSGEVNQIHAAITATERANLHNVTTDCPQRDERMFWLNDATVRFEELPFNFETGRLLPKLVRDIMDSQNETGAIPCTVPFVYGTQPTDPVCSSFLIAVRQAYLHHGNVDLIREAYPALCAWNDCIFHMEKDGIIPNTLYGDWASPEDCCMDIAPFSAITPGTVLSTGYCYYNATLLAWFAEVLLLTDAAKRHRDRAEYIRNAMLKTWLKPDGTFASGSQACQAFALWLGILPEEKRAAVARKLHDSVEAVGYRLTAGNLCTLYVMEELAEHGYVDDAWKLMTRETYPSWGYMLQHDATTIWERFELKKDPTMNSHCHPMYGAVGAWLYSCLAGIRPADAGFSKVILKPCIPEELSFAEAVLDTCKGDFLVKWKKEYGELIVQVTIPFGTEADVCIFDRTHHIHSGTHLFRYNLS